MERCPSGRWCNLGKIVWGQLHQGFESLPLLILNNSMDLTMSNINHAELVEVVKIVIPAGITIIIAIIGWLVALGLQNYNINKNYENNMKLIKEKEDCEAKATLKAILTEIKTLHDILFLEFIQKLDCESDILGYFYPLDTDYFCIYHSNTTQIGKIENEELRENIVYIYAIAKFFIDCVKTNNKVLDELDILESDYKNTSDEIKLMDKNYLDRREIILHRLRLSKKDNLIPTIKNLVNLLNIHLKLIENI